MTLVEAINNAATRFTAAGIGTPRLDAEVLLRHALNKDRAWLLTHFHDTLEEEIRRIFEQAVERRTKREPLQYITGKQEFWGLEFAVSPEVLIPRPETELIIETVLNSLRDRDKACTLVDLCTGSGCIAVVLASELPAARVIATDKSTKALAVARENASSHDVLDRILFIEGDLTAPLESLDIDGQVDIIVSNPPYVRSDDYPTLQPEVKDYEPALALFGGPKGTEVHQRIINAAVRYLKSNGLLIMEMGIGQAETLANNLKEDGRYRSLEILRDLAGIERVIVARRK
jgi:release factor glutamine methyltransferase